MASRWTTVSFAHRQQDLPGQRAINPEKPDIGLSRTFERETDPMKAQQRADLNKPEHQRRDDIAALARKKRYRDHQGQQAPKQGRPSRMVAKDQPAPVLKPSPELPHGSDAESFNARWREENRKAHVAELKQRRDDLLRVRGSFDRVFDALDRSDARARGGDPEGASRDAFKAFRRAQAEYKPVMARSAKITDRAEDFYARHMPRRDFTPTRGERE